MQIPIRMFIFLLAAVFVFPACETLDTGYPGNKGQSKAHKPKQGPPAHAPAHGHRKKHHKDKVELSYDGPLGVYVVIGHGGHYFSGDLFYRLIGEHWEISTGISGPWKVAHEAKVPKGLKDKKKKKPKKSGPKKKKK